MIPPAGPCTPISHAVEPSVPQMFLFCGSVSVVIGELVVVEDSSCESEPPHAVSMMQAHTPATANAPAVRNDEYLVFILTFTTKSKHNDWSLKWNLPITYAGHMGRVPQVKNGHPPKICAACGRPFEWRRKWARDWGNVKYCSDRCRKGSTQT
jgi:hypothetical protein